MNFDELQRCVVKIKGPDEISVRGTGFFVSTDGFIVTCHHVIAGLTQLLIEYDGNSYEVTWQEELSSPNRDIAILTVDPGALQTKIPKIETSDFGDEAEPGMHVDAYGFPFNKGRSFPGGFTVGGVVTPGQPARIAPAPWQQQEIQRLPKIQEWNFLPSEEELRSIDVFNMEQVTGAEPGISGAPVLSTDRGQIIGFVHGRDSKEQRVYVVKWKNVRIRWGNFPLKPASPESPQEWTSPEALQTPGFRKKIRALRRSAGDSFEVGEDDIAITLYLRTVPRAHIMGLQLTGDQTTPIDGSIGSFEYDLTYYWNVLDPTIMFGPTIANDERTRITSGEKLWEINDDPSWKKGGFVEREKIFSTAWFKLGNRLWVHGDLDAVKKISSEEIRGLLFINSRKAGLTEKRLRRSSQFMRALADLELAITEVASVRERKRADRHLKLFDAFAPPNIVDYLVNVKEEIGPQDVNEMFHGIEEAFKYISGDANLAFTVFAYDDERKRLNWLWGNGPTSIGVSTPLPSSDRIGKNIPLPLQVAMDPGHKPRLVHYLQRREEYRKCALVTRLGSTAQSNLVAPILSNYALAIGTSEPVSDKKLIGIIDIQGTEQTEFDTDDVQLIYQLASRYMVNFLRKALPLSLELATVPVIDKQPLDLDIHELLDLNFNPMKYLFHWDRIKPLMTDDPVPFPALVEIWPSMVCNHNCDWCRCKVELDFYGSLGKNKWIGAEGLKALGNELRGQDADVLISGGGEPLLHEDIHQFMEQLKDCRGVVGVFTNGTRPKDFRFWQAFFERESQHSFARVSFNGPDPETYYDIHFHDGDGGRSRESNYRLKYAEARKIVQDLLGLRSKRCTVALGSTVHSRWQETIKDQVTHAKQLGVDFIQIRPELFESAMSPQTGEEIRMQILEQERQHRDEEEFAVKYTDAERAFKNHDYEQCFAMFLVPALVPDPAPGWIRVLPCPYATTARATLPPSLGRMKEGTKLADFWTALNEKLEKRDLRANGVGEGIEVLLEKPINPSQGCPQCRYYMLNKRIIAIKAQGLKIRLITRLVDALEQDPDNIDTALIQEIETTWIDKDIVDIQQAQKAFRIAKKLQIRPSL